MVNLIKLHWQCISKQCRRSSSRVLAQQTKEMQEITFWISNRILSHFIPTWEICSRIPLFSPWLMKEIKEGDHPRSQKMLNKNRKRNKSYSRRLWPICSNKPNNISRSRVGEEKKRSLRREFKIEVATIIQRDMCNLNSF